MSENNFSATVNSLFKGMEGFLTTKTVVGDTVRFEDGTILLPLVDVSFGIGAGAFAENKDGNTKDNGGGGMGGKIQPSAVLLVKDGKTQLVNVKNQDGLTKILDMVPDLLDKHVPKPKKKTEEANVADEEEFAE